MTEKREPFWIVPDEAERDPFHGQRLARLHQLCVDEWRRQLIEKGRAERDQAA